MVKVLTSLSENGGAGKTALAVHLAVAARVVGLDIVIMTSIPRASFPTELSEGEPNLIERIPVSMHDAGAVAGALRAAKADVVALVRGGGNPDEFAIFERPEILSALAACSGYRILGLGHSANRTLAELVADHSATTPAAAGEYVRRRIADGRTRLGLHGTVAELREALEQERRLRQAEAEAVSIFEPVDRDVPLEVVTRRTLADRVMPLIWAAAVGGALAWAALRWL